MLVQLYLDSLENTCHDCRMDVRFLDVVVRNCERHVVTSKEELAKSKIVQLLFMRILK